MNTIWILKRALELKLEKTPTGQPRTREFSEVLKGIKQRGLTGQETEKERLWEQRVIGDFPSTGLYKMETILKE
jgi:hypothetical protein